MLPINKKNIIPLVLAVILSIGSIAGGVYLVKRQQQIKENAQPATTIYLDPSQKSVRSGDIINFDVRVNTGENILAAVRLDIRYDDRVIRPLSFTFNSDLLPQVLKAPNLSQTGKITGSGGVSPGHGITGTSQKIAFISFEVLSGSNSRETEISFSSENTLAVSGINIDEGINLIIRRSPATITLITPKTTPKPTPTGREESCSYYCVDLVAYDSSWNKITNWENLKLPQTINFLIKGEANNCSEEISQARFKFEDESESEWRYSSEIPPQGIDAQCDSGNYRCFYWQIDFDKAECYHAEGQVCINNTCQ